MKCTNAQVLLFFSRAPYVSNDQSCLKTTGPYVDLFLLSSSFHFFYFIFSAPISFSLCSPIFPSLLFSDVLSQAFIKCGRNASVYVCVCVCVCVCVYSILSIYICYFRKLMKFFLTKKFMTFRFHLFDLV